jgi:hypothetical protein
MPVGVVLHEAVAEGEGRDKRDCSDPGSKKAGPWWVRLDKRHGRDGQRCLLNTKTGPEAGGHGCAMC